ncbi:hypothetical protein GCM10011391_39170 [Pullulanibacillus camelliae]|uniref:HTH tetR-type domain-containing protein n=1 Tax=Pullulanibacillus camelliae TaxID=1707096 RepID=A0A8J3DZZ5_9BACL|nr:TetR/AcrR family transcriptional regulator [Pullulanibacillus camelliae]GGE56363.1 hypothetical protein GCM10011391_39170 [Pullulanibacillus camelliae]
METDEKILDSAILLMASKGYKAVTIKEIAAHASVSEMTVYRQFGNKQNILDAIITKFQYASSLKEQLEKELTYDLEHDLLLYSIIYQNYMIKNKQIYMISVLERNTMPDLHLTLHKNVEEIQQFLLDYFRKMQSQGKLIKGNVDSFVALFMRFNYGHFVSETLLGFSNIPISNEEFLKDSISALVTGLTPKASN